MRQALHIFRKDIRQLWRESAAVLVSTALFTIVGLRRTTQPEYLEVVWSLSMLLLPLTWWFLISRLVHAEALTGTRPFWMTRPYSWRSLLAAKALLVIVFINIPLFVANAVILWGYGFQPARLLPGLMLKQAMITVAFLLPSAVLAVLTAGLVQVLLTLVALGVGFNCFMWWVRAGGAGQGGVTWFAFDWLCGFLCAALIAIAGISIVVLQYWKRRTLLSATLALVALLGVAFLAARPPWMWILRVQSRLSKEHVPASAVAVKLDSQLVYATRALFLKNDRVQVEIPVEFVAPSNVSAKYDTLWFEIEASDGTVLPFLSHFQTEDVSKLQATMPGWFYRKIKDAPLRIQGRAYITLFSRPVLTSITPDGRQVAVPGGLCSAVSSEDGKIYHLACTSALRSNHELRTARMQLDVDGRTKYLVPGDQYSMTSYSVLPADFDLDPVSRREYMAAHQQLFWKSPTVMSQPTLKAVEVMTSLPIAHLWTSFEITGPQLSDHEINMLH